MAKSVFTDQYRMLLHLLVAARKAADLTQQDVADRLRRPQSFVAKVESAQRRLDVVEFLAITEAVGADPHAILDQIRALVVPTGPRSRR